MTAALLVALPILAILAGLGGLAGLIYNRLVKASNAHKMALAQIDVQLKRRYDLIPNLVEAARAYLAHERLTLEDVTRARNLAAGAREEARDGAAGALDRLAAADGALNGLLGRLMMVSESYPELKADRAIADLVRELNNTENAISGARATYNAAVRDYNQAIELFPNVIMSGLMGFRKAPSWALADQGEAAPVRFSLGG
ncbi:MAG: LemA family protein [Deltaproteobacteria bacterium]|jgi:LemA protein|nr:LemA family protein [Deltaproteobacteria bacterium]